MPSFEEYLSRFEANKGSFQDQANQVRKMVEVIQAQLLDRQPSYAFKEKGTGSSKYFVHLLNMAVGLETRYESFSKINVQNMRSFASSYLPVDTQWIDRVSQGKEISKEEICNTLSLRDNYLDWLKDEAPNDPLIQKLEETIPKRVARKVVKWSKRENNKTISQCFSKKLCEKNDIHPTESFERNNHSRYSEDEDQSDALALRTKVIRKKASGDQNKLAERVRWEAHSGYDEDDSDEEFLNQWESWDDDGSENAAFDSITKGKGNTEDEPSSITEEINIIREDDSVKICDYAEPIKAPKKIPEWIKEENEEDIFELIGEIDTLADSTINTLIGYVGGLLALKRNNAQNFEIKRADELQSLIYALNEKTAAIRDAKPVNRMYLCMLLNLAINQFTPLEMAGIWMILNPLPDEDGTGNNVCDHQSDEGEDDIIVFDDEYGDARDLEVRSTAVKTEISEKNLSSSGEPVDQIPMASVYSIKREVVLFFPSDTEHNFKQSCSFQDFNKLYSKPSGISTGYRKIKTSPVTY